MRANIKILVGVLLAVGLGACGQPPPQVAAENTPAAPNPYLNLDGSTNYDALRARFGEPNTNLRINPRATDVAQTPSRDTVTVLADRLEFEAADAQWLYAKQVGDTLYCNTACGGDGFGRNIVAINPAGSKIEVLTALAPITDIVQEGWLHATIPVTISYDENGITGVQRSETTTSEGTKTGEYKKGWKGTISADLKPEHSFTVSVDSDFAYTYDGPSWAHPLGHVTVQLVKFVVIGTEKDSLEASVEGKEAYSEKYTWPGAKVPLGVIPLGPVVLDAELELKPYVFVSVSGAIKVSTTIENEKEFRYGFTYSDAAGLNWVRENPPAKATASGTVSGEATASTGFGIEGKLATKLYGVAGPYLEIDPELGARAKAEVSRTTNSDGSVTCEARVSLGDYIKVEGKLGAELELTIPFTSIGYTLEDSITLSDAEKDFNVLDKKTELHSPSALCPGPEGSTGTTETTGATSSGPTGGTTTGGSNGGTTGGTTGGSTTGASTGGSGGTTGGGGPCVSDADCSGGQMCCGGTCVDPTCCPGGETCVQYTNDSNSACSSGTCTCTCGDGTDCSGFSIGCRACNVPSSNCL